jgi:tetratricopeptide (TPR) repeat protein
MSARDRNAPDDVAALIAAGAKLLREGQAEQARTLFQRMVERHPQLVAAHLGLGNAQRRLGAVDAAIASYRCAIRLDPRSAAAHYSLGNACAARGALAEAADAFDAALAIEPGYLAALDGLGNVRLIQERFADALRCFTTIAARDPALPGLAYHAGMAHQGLGDERAAAAAYREALQRDPNYLPALNNLCIALLRSGAPEQALAESERYLARSPANRKALAYRAAALLELGRRDEARALLDFEHLLVEREIPSIANDELVAAILRHPSLRFEPAEKSTRGGSQTGELVAGADGALAALGDAIRTSVQVYIDHVRRVAPAHPYVAHLPDRWRIATWGVVLKASGHQTPHFHPDGHVSGVYYVKLPRALDDHAGWIEFGRTRDALGGSGDPLLHLVRPREGLMLLFPSYFYHRTIPFEGDEQRVSIAFDVLAVG